MSAIRKGPDTGVFGLGFVTSSTANVQYYYSLFPRILEAFSKIRVRPCGIRNERSMHIDHPMRRRMKIAGLCSDSPRYLCLPLQGKHWSIQSGQSPPLN